MAAGVSLEEVWEDVWSSREGFIPSIYWDRGVKDSGRDAYFTALTFCVLTVGKIAARDAKKDAL